MPDPDPPRIPAQTDAADRIVGIYRRHAAAWTGARRTDLMEKPWLDRFRDLLRPGAAVLDIGCGPGDPIARYFAGNGHAVVGVDSSPEMIALFKRNLPNETAEVADMRCLKLGRRFGGVVAWDSFFHLRHDDQRRMFPVFRDHAEQGAPLMFTSGPAFGEAIGTLEGEPLYHASLDPEEYRLLLDQNGFDVIPTLRKMRTAAGTRSGWRAGGRAIWSKAPALIPSKPEKLSLTHPASASALRRLRSWNRRSARRHARSASRSA